MTEAFDGLAAGCSRPLPDSTSDACAVCGPVGPLGVSVAPHSRPWTFLTNHAHVLVAVAREPGTRVRDVAQSVGITERCVHRILADLEEGGYVTRVHEGRRNHYEVHADLPLRHPAEQHRQVSALLHLVSGDNGGDRERNG